MSALPDCELATVAIDVVVPVHNEEHDLAPCVRRLHEHLSGLPYSFRITIADNASTDGTSVVGHRLSRQLESVRYEHLAQKGRGRALKRAWSSSDAGVLVYMDVDLSTDLNALLPLVAPLLSGHSDIAIGSRLTRGSRVVRGPKREVISRCYNLLLRTSLQARFSDAQCGFKAIRGDVARRLLPLVEDDAWFFDTELLVLAERAGLRIHEVPVDWVDDPDSRVDLLRTAYDDLRGIGRLALSLARGRVPLDQVVSTRTGLAPQVASFAAIGIASTVAYAFLYLVLRPLMSAQLANAAALLLTAVANTAANRRLTFGVRGRAGATRHQVQGLLVFGAGLAVTSLALRLVPQAPTYVEVCVLMLANLLVTVARFLAMRLWIFRRAVADRSTVR
jgi:putative flippase GtrA